MAKLRTFKVHGYVAYTHGCRCDTCREAKRAYVRASRAVASAKRERSPELGRYIAPGITHGTYSGYQNSHCRCLQCTAVKASRDRERYLRLKERAS